MMQPGDRITPIKDPGTYRVMMRATRGDVFTMHYSMSSNTASISNIGIVACIASGIYTAADEEGSQRCWKLTIGDNIVGCLGVHDTNLYTALKENEGIINIFTDDLYLGNLIDNTVLFSYCIKYVEELELLKQRYHEGVKQWEMRTPYRR